MFSHSTGYIPPSRSMQRPRQQHQPDVRAGTCYINVTIENKNKNGRGREEGYLKLAEIILQGSDARGLRDPQGNLHREGGRQGQGRQLLKQLNPLQAPQFGVGAAILRPGSHWDHTGHGGSGQDGQGEGEAEYLPPTPSEETPPGLGGEWGDIL